MVYGVRAVSERIGIHSLDLRTAEHHSEHAADAERAGGADELRGMVREPDVLPGASRLQTDEDAVGDGLVDVVAFEHAGREPVWVVPSAAR